MLIRYKYFIVLKLDGRFSSELVYRPLSYTYRDSASNRKDIIERSLSLISY